MSLPYFLENLDEIHGMDSRTCVRRTLRDDANEPTIRLYVREPHIPNADYLDADLLADDIPSVGYVLLGAMHDEHKPINLETLVKKKCGLFLKDAIDELGQYLVRFADIDVLRASEAFGGRTSNPLQRYFEFNGDLDTFGIDYEAAFEADATELDLHDGEDKRMAMAALADSVESSSSDIDLGSSFQGLVYSDEKLRMKF